MNLRQEVAVDLIKASLWPIIAVIVLVMFHSPLYSLIDGIAGRTNSIDTIKIGNLELHVKISELPVPSGDIAAVLPKLDRDMTLSLLAIDKNYGGCFPRNDEGRKRLEVFHRLRLLSLVTLKNEEESFKECRDPRLIELTQRGRDARSFLVSLLNSQIGERQIKSASPYPPKEVSMPISDTPTPLLAGSNESR
jgi:hypothetical protein